MVIVVKGFSYKRLLIKSLSYLSLLAMFYLYYGHMSTKFQDEKIQLGKELTSQKKQNMLDKSLGYEKEIYKEAVVIVDLLEQKHIQSIKIVKDKMLIICDYNTNIEPVLIRYGVKAFVKNTAENIKIAIDVKTIVENKYNEA